MAKTVVDRDRILRAIEQCLIALNEDRSRDEQIPLTEGTLLLDDESPLDSLSFVSFATDLEGRLRELTDAPLQAVSDLWSDPKAVRDVGTLTDNLSILLNK